MTRPLHPALGAGLFRQLAAATRHRLPLHEVADILAQDPQAPASERSLLAALAADLGGGAALSDAMHRAPAAFDAATIDWVRLAERQGRLADTLDALAADFERCHQAQRALHLALLWPLCLLGGIALLLVTMATYVMPAFSEMYRDFGVDMPLPSRLVFAGAGRATELWWLWLPLLAALAMGYATRRLPLPLWRGIDGLLGRIGFVRRVRLANFVSRLLELSHLLWNDPALHAAALGHLAATARTPPLARAAARLQEAVTAGMPLSQALAAEALLPARLSLYTRLGEKMQDLAAPLAQLREAAELTHREALARFERGVVLTLYLLLGLAVGAIVIAVYLPIFQLGSIV